MATPRLTKPTIGVLEVLLSARDDNPAWGLKICMDADLGSGTVYPILERLSNHGWVTSWTETEPHPGRPPRRFYQLTGMGRLAADVALKERAARQARFRLAGGLA
ncbi:Predicted transcriptional regulators [Streptomyces sp. MnatMP-M77]|uniref:PadR family transcriptional regulator n=1 Tax=unclassified Streptomyces TaxID=2593676 RepID=UPI000804F9A7|nr:helix-turn-helix transcriptional regulator [Streptomyces sp. MnatMP-M77]MYT83039.1 PadR family transcriptional regulator [Streptomyces sp. SID8364]SBV06198.1 Predicted transcriptional regulators [Streptomyces sp. MnatMP-M77]